MFDRFLAFTKPGNSGTRYSFYFLATIFVQVLLILYTFRTIIFEPAAHFFYNEHDGFKNYFTFYAYLKQPLEQGFLKFNQFNYPFGDYVLFTDNTPLFAVILKLFSHYIFDISLHGIWLFHLFLISGILLSSVFVFKILQRFVPQIWLVSFFAVVLPWLNPQVLRFQIGHFNLSLSWILLALYYGLLRMHDAGFKGKQALRWSIFLIIVLVLASFLHMYYLLLGSAFVGFFFLFGFFQELLQRKLNLRHWFLPGLTIVLPLVLTYSITRIIDGYFHLRRASAEGYGWDEWKLTLSALFTPYSHNKIGFLFSSTKEIPYESYAYLGAFGLFGIMFWVLIYYFDKENRALLSLKKVLQGNSFLVLCGLASLACVFIAIGEEYHFSNREWVFKNYFSAFFYLHKLTDMVTQFRCLGRFSWVFFWFFNFAAVYVLSYFMRNYPRRWFAYVAGVLLLLAILDMKDTINHIRKSVIKDNNLTAENAIQNAQSLLKGINVTEYQAVLPVPFFHVGSENYNFTIDPEDNYGNETMRFSLLSGLPLIGNKMSRTPQIHAEMLFSIFSEKGISAELKQKLNKKPVLVLLNKTFYDGRNNFGNNISLEPAKSVFLYGPQIVAQYKLEKLAENEEYVLYRWQL